MGARCSAVGPGTTRNPTRTQLVAAVGEVFSSAVGAGVLDVEQRALQAAERLFEEGQYQEAEAQYRTVMSLREGRLGPNAKDHEDYVWAMQDAAACVMALNRMEEAETMLRHVLAVRRVKMGLNHPSTLWTVSSLANCCSRLQRWSEAVSLYETILQEDVTGGDAQTLVMLGQCHLSMANPTEAKRVLDQALLRLKQEGAPMEEFLGVEEMLCTVMVDQAQYEQAQMALEEVKAKRLSLGLETIDTDLLLANVLYYRSNLEGAIELYRSCLERSRALNGEFHENTLACINNLANAQLAAGSHREGLHLLEKAVEDFTRELGSSNSTTWDVKGSYAGALSMVGRYQESARKWEEVLTAMKTIMHPEHLRVLQTAVQLACVNQLLSKFTSSEETVRECLKLMKHYQGEEHPSTLNATQALANILLAQGKLSEAEKLVLQVQEVRLRLFGEDHLESMGICNDVANVFLEQGKFAQAGEIYEKTLKLRTERSGADHPDTLSVATNLGSCICLQGRYEEAETWNRKCLESMSRVYGEEHPHTLCARENMARSLFRCGKYDECLELEERNLELRSEVLGPLNYVTLETRNNMGHVLFKMGLAERKGERQPEGRDLQSGSVDPGGDFAGRDLGNPRLNAGVRILQEVLQQRRETLGSAHVYTLNSMYSVAKCFLYCHHEDPAQGLEDLEKGIQLCQHALEFRTSLLGTDHLDHWRALGLLSRLHLERIRLWQLQGDASSSPSGRSPEEISNLTAQSQEQIRDAARNLERILGASHPAALCWRRRADSLEQP